MRTALVNGRVLAGEKIVNGHTVLLADGRIEAIAVAADPRCRDAASVDLEGHILLPGFIDTHIHYPQTDVIAAGGSERSMASRNGWRAARPVGQ